MLFSIIMPAYNSQATIKESIASVLNQTYQNFELIIINDNSSDA
ncbi:glycosyltransferase family 2 protein, partial [Escherichia coli]|nr:glycosyltransferase family 2 protein [Escherichia coli]